MFQNLNYNLANLIENLAGDRFPLLAHASGSLQKLINEPPSRLRTAEERYEYRENQLAEFKRLKAKENRDQISIERFPEKLSFTFHKEETPNAAPAAYYFTHYLHYLEQGRYGAIPNSVKFEVPTPVQFEATPQITDIVRGSLRGRTSAEARGLMYRAANQISPQHQLISYGDLLDTVERKANLELDFPVVKFVVTADPRLLDFIIRSARRHLNLGTQNFVS